MSISRACRCISTIAWREIWSMLVTPATWFVVALFVLISSFVFYLVPLQYHAATFIPMVDLIKFLGIFFTPLITMRLFAEEKRNGTLETLMTVPVRPLEIVLAKALSGMVFYCLVLSPCAVYIALLSHAGDMDNGAVTAQMLGLFLLGMVYVSGGLLISAAASSQIAASAGSIVLLMTLWLLHEMGGSGLVGSLITGMSIKTHFDDSFVKGVLDSADVVYFITLTSLFLTGTWMIVRTAAQPARTGTQSRRAIFLTAILAALAAESTLFGLAQLDLYDKAASLNQLPWSSLLRLGAPFLLTLIFLGGLAWRMRKNRTAQSNGYRHYLATIIGFIALALILININIIAGRAANRIRIDMSEAGMNTLDVRTRQTLDSLEEECRITVFFTQLDKYEGFDLLPRTRDLLKEYTTHTPHISVEYVDPAQVPTRAMELARAWRLDGSRLDRMAMVAYAGRRAVVPIEMVLQKKASLVGGPAEIIFLGEQAFTSAIRRVEDPRMPRIQITQGHGEFFPFQMEGGARGMGDFVQSLRLDGMQVQSLSLMEDRAIPDNCDVLIIPGAFTPFSPAQLTSIRKYVEKGGHVLILLDPPLVEGETTGLENILAQWGIGINNDHAFDSQHTLAGDASTVLALGSDKHPITASGRAVMCYLQRAGSLKILGNATPGWVAQQVLISTSTAGTQTFHPAGGKARAMAGLKGPFALAASAEHPSGGRVLVVGDADLASNFGLKLAHNRAFLTSATEWLLGREHSIQIPEREDVDRSISMTEGDRKFIWWVALVALPQAWALAGLLIWWLRRQ